METRRSLIVSVASLSTIGISGCLGGNNSENTGNTNNNSGDSQVSTEGITAKQQVLNAYEKAYTHHQNGMESLRKALNAENGETVKKHTKDADESFNTALSKFNTKDKEFKNTVNNAYNADTLRDVPATVENALNGLQFSPQVTSQMLDRFESYSGADEDLTPTVFVAQKDRLNNGQLSIPSMSEMESSFP